MSRVLPAQLELAQPEFKDQPEQPACPVLQEPQGQEQLVLQELAVMAQLEPPVLREPRAHKAPQGCLAL